MNDQATRLDHRDRADSANPAGPSVGGSLTSRLRSARRFSSQMIRGVIGLFRRQSPEPTPQEIDPSQIIRRSRWLRFQVRPTAVSQLAGAYLSARPGTGLTFSELRAYEPGDDVRHLDWNVTARQGRPFVRRYVEERSLNLWLIVDVSASLRFGPDGQSKVDRAAKTAAMLASAAIQNGDRVGLTLVTDRIEAELPPGGGPRHFASVLRTLVATPASSRRTALAKALERPRRFPRRGLIVVISDFLSTEPISPWRRIARRGEVVAIRLCEPREEQVPRVGLLALEDAETGHRRVIDTSSGRMRRAYAEAADRRQKQFQNWCATARITGLDLSTTEDPLGPLLRYFRGRAERFRRSR